jgi:hypothetical protein
VVAKYRFYKYELHYEGKLRIRRLNLAEPVILARSPIFTNKDSLPMLKASKPDNRHSSGIFGMVLIYYANMWLKCRVWQIALSQRIQMLDCRMNSVNMT